MYRTCSAVLTLIAALALAPGLSAQDTISGPLAEYVAKQDDSYGWVKRREGKLGRAAFAELILTSQEWRGISWKHQLFVIHPSSTAANTQHALLFITGGRWKDSLQQPPQGEEKMPREANLFAALAEQLKTPVAVLLQVPHQPMFDGKYEDAIIALTFENYLRTGDQEWPLLLPMVKSAVRAMDAVHELSEQDWSLDIKTYTVTGASKRGWTTWLTGAVDRRAVAIAPMVIDVLNMAQQMQHQKTAWGELSYKINDYSERGLHEHLQSDSGKSLRAIIDPYSYRKLLTQPKLIILGTNDHYWPLDALNLYWDDLVGEKHVLYVPNNRHGLDDYGRLIGSLNALHQNTVRGTSLPKLEWRYEQGEKAMRLQITSDTKPVRVEAWTATSESRDFRESRWASVPVEEKDGKFLHAEDFPNAGYSAIFAEAVYEEGGMPFYLSTNVRVLQSSAK